MPDRMMRRVRPWARGLLALVVWVSVAAVIVTLAYEASDGWEPIWQRIAQGDFEPLVLAALLNAAAIALLATVWSLTLIPLRKFQPDRVPAYLRVWIYTYLCRYVPGKVLLVVERVRLGRRLGLAPEWSVRALLAESLFLVFGGLLLLAAIAMFHAEVIPGTWNALLLVFGCGLVLASLPMLISLARNAPIGFIASRAERFASIRLPMLWQIGLSGLCAVAWCALAGSFLTVLVWVAGPLSVDWGVTVFWFIAAYLTGNIVSLAPAGIGVREGVLAGGLSSMVPLEIAAGVTLLARMVSVVAELGLMMPAFMVRLPAAEPHPGGSDGSD